MRHSIPFLFLLIACACGRVGSGTAIFESFVYRGAGECAAPDGFYANPVMKGFYPDPSICRKDGDYYMVNSTFQYFPAVPVWHSTDLVQWEQCSSVLTSDAQIAFTRKKMNLGNYAPSISYNPDDGLFYVACTQVGGGLGNWYCTSPDPRSGSWDGPFVIEGVRGIDPEFYFDGGKAYYLTCTSPADAHSQRRYEGEFAIVMWEFDCATGKICSGPRIIARGGARPEQEPKNLEGPHLFKKDGRYYLICAEGGTEAFHREVVFSSQDILGPFEPCAVNPILTQAGLPAGRPDAVSCTGHADMVCTPGGAWYAVFLGCRPYEGEEYFNTGRETFLLPVRWEGGQPVILEQGEAVPMLVEMDAEMRQASAASRIKGFDAADPGPLWDASGLAGFAMTVRGSLEGRTAFDRRGRMHLECTGEPLDSCGRPSAVLQRIASKRFEAQTVMEFTPSENHEAGLLCWYDDDNYVKFVKRLDERGTPVLVLESRSAGVSPVFEGYTTEREHTALKRLATITLTGPAASSPIALRISADSPWEYVFSYAPAGKGKPLEFIPAGAPVDARTLSTRHCAGHQGTMVGVYAF